MKIKQVVIKMRCHCRGMLLGIFNAYCYKKKDNSLLNGYVEDPRQRHSGMTPNLMGFTLIELLVVVLIIGILAAVALPQYQRAVEKAAAAEALPLLDALYQASQAYYLEHGAYPTQFSQLDVTIPWTGTKKWRTGSTITDTRSNEKWSVQIYHERAFSPSFYLGRISGAYAGTGFVINMDTGRMSCAEKTAAGYIFRGNPGDYCVKLFHASTAPATYDNGRYYRIL